MVAHRLITASDLKRQRGWTETLVTALLGAPDAHAPNPHGFRAPQRFFRFDRVVAAEGTTAWAAREAKLSEKQTWRRTLPSKVVLHTEVAHLEWLDDPWRIRLFHAPRRPRMRRPKRVPEPVVLVPAGQRFEVLTLF